MYFGNTPLYSSKFSLKISLDKNRVFLVCKLLLIAATYLKFCTKHVGLAPLLSAKFQDVSTILQIKMDPLTYF